MGKLIPKLALGFVFLLALGSFIMSYNALYHVALDNGIPPGLAYVWPLLIDFALVVFSLAVLRSSLLGENTFWAWCLTGLFALSTIAFNILHAPNTLTAIAVAVVAPIALVLAFETSMAMVKSDVRRSGAVQSIEQITAKLSGLEVEYQEKRDNLAAELEKVQHDQLAEIETLAQTKQGELDKANRELETVQARIAKAEAELRDILGQVEGQKAGQEERSIPVVIIGEGLDLPKMKPAERQKYLPQLLNGGVDKDKILDIFNISAKTLDRDIKECNGLIIDPVDIPGAAGHRNGHKRG